MLYGGQGRSTRGGTAPPHHTELPPPSQHHAAASITVPSTQKAASSIQQLAPSRQHPSAAQHPHRLRDAGQFCAELSQLWVLVGAHISLEGGAQQLQAGGVHNHTGQLDDLLQEAGRQGKKRARRQ